MDVMPRNLTDDYLNSLVLGVYYNHVPNSTVVTCFVELRNGTFVSGKSYSGEHRNFDVREHEALAYADAFKQIRMLEAYMLQQAAYLCKRVQFIPDPDMNQPYIGTKVVFPKYMNKGAYCALRGWEVPEGEDPEEQGYLVMYADGGEPNVPGYPGYVSWSPKTVFETNYHYINEEAVIS